MPVRFSIRNAGRATARDVTVEIIRWGDELGSLGQTVGKASVAAALLVGEDRRVEITIPAEEAERTGLDITAYWEDDNGRNERSVGRL